MWQRKAAAGKGEATQTPGHPGLPVIPVPRSLYLPGISAHRDHRLNHPASYPNPTEHTSPPLQQKPGFTTGHSVETGDAVVPSFLNTHIMHSSSKQSSAVCLSISAVSPASLCELSTHTHTHTHTHTQLTSIHPLASAPAVITRIKHSRGTSKVFISSGLISDSSGLC